MSLRRGGLCRTGSRPLCRAHASSCPAPPADAAAEAAADALVHKALQAGSSDNLTAVLLVFDWGA